MQEQKLVNLKEILFEKKKTSQLEYVALEKSIEIV